MLSGGRFGALVRAVARRPGAVLAVVGAVALAAVALSLRLETSASTNTLVDRGSESFEATERFRQNFGDEAIVVLVRGDLQRTVLTSNLGRLISLEGCLSGNVPAQGLARLPPQCRELARRKPAKVVYGPGTFINTAAGQIAEGFDAQRKRKAREAEDAGRAAEQLAARKGYSKARQKRLGDSARQLVYSQFIQSSLQLALRYGITSVPSIDNVDFVSQLVFDTSRGVNVPKARFAYLFPSPRAALIQVRLRPNLSEGDRQRAVELIREATSQPSFRLEGGASYVVSGVPVVVEGLAAAVERSIVILLIAAVIVMAGTLALVFRSPLRLLPLAIALAAAAMAYGAVSLAGGSLTMASIAALPVLIGLAVDYAIQFQARFNEMRAIGERPPPAAVAAPAAATAGGPTIASAGVATAVGFLVLLLSPVPMVRGFGVLLVIGIVIALVCALTAGFAFLVRFSDARRPDDLPPAMPRARERAEALLDRLRSSRAGEAIAAAAVRLRYRLAPPAQRIRAAVAERGRRAFALAIEQPARVLAIGLAVAVLGWLADTQTEVISDVRELVPQDLQALRDVNTLQEATGVSGEIDVTVSAPDLTAPAVIAWMTRFQQDVLRAHGYRPGATCAQRDRAPELCPALSLPDLFRSTDPSDQRNVRGLLAAVPPYFSQAVISPDRRMANLAFGIRLMPLERQKEVIDDIERRLETAPPGVNASVAGLPVLAAEANGALSSAGRRQLALLAALAAVFLVLLAFRRRARQAAVPLIPIALATGWSALVLFLLRIPLNPMSATLGALVIAISTEFSVLLSARYAQERQAGASPRAALERTYSSTGAAVLASGTTAIAGFAALVASDIRMLRDFGAVTVIDLTASLLGVMVVLPAALVWAEEHGPFRLRDLDPRAWWRALRVAVPPRPWRPRASLMLRDLSERLADGIPRPRARPGREPIARQLAGRLPRRPLRSSRRTRA